MTRKRLDKLIYVLGRIVKEYRELSEISVSPIMSNHYMDLARAYNYVKQMINNIHVLNEEYKKHKLSGDEDEQI